jgi:uncharacterized damage-inducible protein DinB
LNNEVLNLYNYHAWANDQILAHLQTLPEEICRTTIQSVFPNIHDVLVHLYVIDCGWLDILISKGFSDMTAEQIDQLQRTTAQYIQDMNDKNIEEIQIMFTRLSDRFRTFLEHEDLDTICAYGTFEARRRELIQHVVNHGTYHRGNIAAMLRQLGHSGVQTDYTLYLFVKTA